MSHLKDILCLLLVVSGYGIAGRMDYDDAVMLDEAQRQTPQTIAADCLDHTEMTPDTDVNRGSIESDTCATAIE